MKHQANTFLAVMILLTCMAVKPLWSSAADYSLVVYTTTGSRTAFAFADRPELSIDGTTFRIRSAVADVEYAALDIARFTLETSDDQQPVPTGNYWLVVWTKDGRSAGYAFAAHPVVSIDGNTFYVGKDGSKAVGYRASNILRFTISDHFEQSAGEVVKADGVAAEPALRPQLRLSPTTMCVSGLTPDAPVRIFDGSGRLVQQAVADSDGSLTMSMLPLRRGVYVISSGQTSFKIIRK